MTAPYTTALSLDELRDSAAFKSMAPLFTADAAERVLRDFESALLSKLRAPVADELVDSLARYAYYYAVDLDRHTRNADLDQLEGISRRATAKLKAEIRATLTSAQVDPEAAEVDFMVRVFENLDTWRAEDWNELLERRPAILALLRPMVLASAPVAPQACRSDVCQAAKADGVLCANDECDRANGVRPASAPVAGEAVAYRVGTDLFLPEALPAAERYAEIRQKPLEPLYAAPQASEAVQLLRKVREDGYLSDTMNHRIAMFFACQPQASEAELKEAAAIARSFGAPDMADALDPPKGPVQAGDAVREADQPVFAFLLGEGPLRGVHFGERAPGAIGKWWWRQELRAALSAQPGANAEPYGWLYDWTHSSATGKPDSHYTGFTTDKAYAQGHDNPRAVYLSAQPGAQKGCNCAACRPHSVEMRMILCEVCGDKRCPHAADHRNACTGAHPDNKDGGANGQD